jgi:hypothetical protein
VAFFENGFLPFDHAFNVDGFEWFPGHTHRFLLRLPVSQFGPGGLGWLAKN